MHRSKRASSQVAWALLTEGVTEARVNLHRLRLMVDRGLSLIQESEKRDHFYQMAGDLIEGAPSRLAEAERALDRTSYALTVMGEEFLRGRLPFDDRHKVDESVSSSSFASKRPKESVLRVALASRVAQRFMEASAHTLSAEHWFADTPTVREVREFAESGALSNDPNVASQAVRGADNPDRSAPQAKQEANEAPPTPSQIEKGPGGNQFSTLNRFIVKTEQPGVGRVPKGWDEVPKSKII